jgi:hypothetical protein
MTLDLNTYRHSVKPVVKIFCDRNKRDAANAVPVHELLGRIAVATSCPIIAVGYYVGELYGFSDELNEKLRKLEEFYRIDSVTGKQTPDT